MINIDESFKKSVGERIKGLREKNNYSIENLIEKLDNEYYLHIDEKTIRRYEKGEFLPKIDNLIVFSELFDVTLDYLVFGKETSNDNSYTWKDTFKRLNRLIYSCVLFPFKEENQNSSIYGKYYCIGFDEELKLYLDKVMEYVNCKNYAFEVRDKNAAFDIHDLDNLIREFSSYTEQLTPTQKRLNDIMIKSGGNPEQYLREKIESINKRRKV